MNYIFTILILLNLVFGSNNFNTKISSIDYNYDVEILRDKWGVPHIYGVTDEDVAFGFAYAHSEDDFKTIQDVILQTRGELSSVYGKKMIPIDYMTNILQVRLQIYLPASNTSPNKTHFSPSNLESCSASMG